MGNKICATQVAEMPPVADKRKLPAPEASFLSKLSKKKQVVELLVTEIRVDGDHVFSAFQMANTARHASLVWDGGALPVVPTNHKIGDDDAPKLVAALHVTTCPKWIFSTSEKMLAHKMRFTVTNTLNLESPHATLVDKAGLDALEEVVKDIAKPKEAGFTFEAKKSQIDMCEAEATRLIAALELALSKRDSDRSTSPSKAGSAGSAAQTPNP